MTHRLPRGRARSFYARALSAADREAFEDAHDIEGLADEVALLRLQIRRLLEEEPVDVKVVQSGMRLLVQTLVAEQRLSGRQAEGLGEAAAQLIEEFGALLAAPEEGAHA